MNIFSLAFTALIFIPSHQTFNVGYGFNLRDVVVKTQRACTCGPTCPTPVAHKWPIPASMNKVKR